MLATSTFVSAFALWNTAHRKPHVTFEQTEDDELHGKGCTHMSMLLPMGAMQLTPAVMRSI